MSGCFMENERVMLVHVRVMLGHVRVMLGHVREKLASWGMSGPSQILEGCVGSCQGLDWGHCGLS